MSENVEKSEDANGGLRCNEGLGEWSQKGFVVISWYGEGLPSFSSAPMVHRFFLTDWQAKEELERIERELPKRLRVGAKVVRCELKFLA